jgi:hypothetical protein
MTTTTISPIDAAEALGIDTFDLARHLRAAAAEALESLASDCKRGGETAEGDIGHYEFNQRAAQAWRIVESAQACDADWQARFEDEVPSDARQQSGTTFRQTGAGSDA